MSTLENDRWLEQRFDELIEDGYSTIDAETIAEHEFFNGPGTYQGVLQEPRYCPCCFANYIDTETERHAGVCVACL